TAADSPVAAPVDSAAGNPTFDNVLSNAVNSPATSTPPSGSNSPDASAGAPSVRIASPAGTDAPAARPDSAPVPDHRSPSPRPQAEGRPDALSAAPANGSDVKLNTPPDLGAIAGAGNAAPLETGKT